MASLPAIARLPSGPQGRAGAYAWLVFALSFGLLLSDYMSRQVLIAVFPLLKSEWQLTDADLGLLSGVVALAVGALTLPLSWAADRWGRIASLTAMAILWSLATLLCAFAQEYDHMLAGRVLVGVGEAAYGSVGIAVVISVFPASLRATLTALFLAGSLVGQVTGIALGAYVAELFGWRAAFAAMGLFGLVLGLVYPIVVTERRVSACGHGPAQGAERSGRGLRALLRNGCFWLILIANGCQYFVAGALPAWLPSYFYRYYALPVDRAGQLAAVVLLLCAVGMVVWGVVCDRIMRRRPDRAPMLAAGCCLGSAAALTLALAVPAGTAQVVLLALAALLVGGTTGPAGAIVTSLAPVGVRATAFACVVVANNLIGLAPGPYVTGRLSDAIGLLDALRMLPLASLAALIAFLLAGRRYPRSSAPNGVAAPSGAAGAVQP